LKNKKKYFFLKKLKFDQPYFKCNNKSGATMHVRHISGLMSEKTESLPEK
jgi:hypothetical protein